MFEIDTHTRAGVRWRRAAEYGTERHMWWETVVGVREMYALQIDAV